MRQPDSHILNRPDARLQRRHFLGGTAALIAAVSIFGHGPAMAQEYPGKPIRVIVPFPPGGSTDTASRIMSESLSGIMKQTFVVENKSGAAGTIGTASVTRAKADGYTLGIGPVGSTIIAKLIGMQVPYDPVNDLIPIGNIGSLPLVVAVKADLPVNSLADLVELAKSKPGKLSYGTSGAGTPGHLAFEYFKDLASIDIVHVAYRGDSPLTTDMLGGQLEVGILTGPAAAAQVASGKMKYLAVTSGQRYPQLPDVPTVIESGYKDFNIEIWNLLIAPSATDPKILQKLNEAMNTFLQQDKAKTTLKAQGYLPPVLMSLEEVKKFVAADRKKWETIVNTTGVRIGD
ncbi:hypothetical protein CR155_19745 [Pollutimonas nitritireducens]|uniref:Tripartite tricarboxylate transporter substrate binding protein n=1 Tax=Pollutimonas nitritireducens TaxID=2045209 RepID=A0A2N4UAU7_9BURK|nr:tripartite tricarboxylate transporter substrate binding protein [Pollutimonas nitritireducens]PLC52140.1 hypothetical protein CR155_19745 [Pollutimonas nitritireducens]